MDYKQLWKVVITTHRRLKYKLEELFSKLPGFLHWILAQWLCICIIAASTIFLFNIDSVVSDMNDSITKYILSYFGAFLFPVILGGFFSYLIPLFRRVRNFISRPVKPVISAPSTSVNSQMDLDALHKEIYIWLLRGTIFYTIWFVILLFYHIENGLEDGLPSDDSMKDIVSYLSDDAGIMLVELFFTPLTNFSGPELVAFFVLILIPGTFVTASFRRYRLIITISISDWKSKYRNYSIISLLSTMVILILAIVNPLSRNLEDPLLKIISVFIISVALIQAIPKSRLLSKRQATLSRWDK